MPPRTHRLAVDPSRPLAQQPEIGHNRWHEDISPALDVAPGDTVSIETLDAFDGQLTPQSTHADVGRADLSPVHPLTGPVYVQGAEPGDLLEVKLLDIDPDPFEAWGYTAQVPGFGFLRDWFPEPFLVHWRLLGKQYAESAEIPGVRIRYQPFPGVIGLAPSRELREQAERREQALLERGGFVVPPGAEGAVPAAGPAAERGLRTIPPRENAGNIDIKQLTPGSSLLLPVWVEGALFSTGDVHFAQGDCEACGTAIEMRSVVHVQFALHKGEAQRRNLRDLQFFRDDYFVPPELAAPRRFYATTGIPVTREGENRSEDLTLAAQNALLNMIDYLGTRGYSPQQAYALCSVAVDLRVSQVVDVPNFIITALLPLDIFL